MSPSVSNGNTTLASVVQHYDSSTSRDGAIPSENLLLSLRKYYNIQYNLSLSMAA